MPKTNSMKNASLKTIAKKMKDLDFCMMITQDENNGLYSRPMSNNGQVEYDGDSWFFTYEDSRKIEQIKKVQQVSLVFQGEDMLFLQCFGEASIIKEKSVMEEKWIDELERWFPQGIDTPGICLIKVKASHIQFWQKEEEGEYKS